jgi:hypothetical protein
MDMMHWKNHEPIVGQTVTQTAARPRLCLPRLVLLGLSLLVLLDRGVSIAGDTVYTGRHALKIPFDFKDEQIQQLKATEVQLLVSTDRGKSWKTASKAKPQDRLFRYNAADNGHYWFAVRMMNAKNQPVQPGAPQVGLKVTVDDIPPLLELKVREITPGRVELTWQAEDDALNLDTLEIQYREGDNGEWKPVSIPTQAVGRMDITVSAAGTVFVAGRVTDLAKNEVTVEDQASVSSETKTQTRETEPDFSKPVAIQPRSEIGDRAPGSMSQIITDSSLTARPLPQSISQSMSSQNLAPPSPATRPSMYAPGTKVVKANVFNIGYSLDQVGPSGVGGVDLFITEDNGRTWFTYGSDPDRKSPFTVRVEHGGQFGFAIRARNGIGLSDDPPRNGHPPEILVVVDQIAPRPKLGTLTQGQGLTHNQVQFSWVLVDADLPELPVMISRAYSPTGPWEPISGWVENSGRYIWTVEQSIDRPIYIRLEARDLAGNIGKADSDQPLQIDLMRPTARILDIESVTQ